VDLPDFFKPKLVQESELRANESGAQKFQVITTSGITTTSQYLATGSGRITIHNLGTTVITIGQSREVSDGDGHPLKASTGAGDGTGGEIKLFTWGPIYGISSASGGKVSILKE